MRGKEKKRENKKEAEHPRMEREIDIEKYSGLNQKRKILEIKKDFGKDFFELPNRYKI